MEGLRTHHRLLRLSWGLQCVVPLGSGGTTSSTCDREECEGEKPCWGDASVRGPEPVTMPASTSAPEQLLPSRVGVPVHRAESPPSLASCFRLRYSSRDTYRGKDSHQPARGGKRNEHTQGPVEGPLGRGNVLRHRTRTWPLPDPTTASSRDFSLKAEMVGAALPGPEWGLYPGCVAQGRNLISSSLETAAPTGLDLQSVPVRWLASKSQVRLDQKGQPN